MDFMISGRNIFAVCLFFLSALSNSAYSQQNGSSGGSTGSNSGTSTTVPERKEPTIVNPIIRTDTGRLPPREIQPIFISGNVMQEDGSEPPDGSIIEMDCGWTKTREAVVSPNGRFSFQYGGGRRFREIVPDASESNSYSKDEETNYWGPGGNANTSGEDKRIPLNMKLSGCDLRAQLSGYRSSSIRLNATMLTTVNEVGSIVIYPLDRIRGTSVSTANLLAPKKAKSLLNQAAKAFKKERYGDAERLMKSAIEIYPKYVEAWMLIGKFYQHQERFKEAEEALKSAEEIDPFFVNPQVQMCWVFANEKKWSELAEKSENALNLDPVTYPELYYLSALAHYNIQGFDQAEKRAGQAKLRDTLHQYPKIHLILANIFEAKNSLGASKEELRSYLLYAPNASDAPLIRKRMSGISEKAALQSEAH
jgi:hypothetical protein